jgi:hypothetical protein
VGEDLQPPPPLLGRLPHCRYRTLIQIIFCRLGLIHIGMVSRAGRVPKFLSRVTANG